MPCDRTLSETGHREAGLTARHMADKAAHRPTLTSTIDELSRIHQDVTDYAKQAEALRDLLHAAEEQHRLAAHAFAAERRQLVADLKAKELEVSLVPRDFNMEPLHSGHTGAGEHSQAGVGGGKDAHAHTRSCPGATAVRGPRGAAVESRRRPQAD